MKKTWVLGFFALLAIAPSIQGQDAANIWRTLGMVQIEKEFDPMIGLEIIRPTYGPLIERLAGETVEVRGYIIPLSGKRKQSHFMFSAYPYDQCFFCGQAGPETAMEVAVKGGKEVAYREDAIVLRGVLRLSQGEVNGLLYRLDDAEVISD